MKPKNRTLNIYQGQTLRTQFLFVDANANPINLAAKTARLQCRQYIESIFTIFELTTENGGITLESNGMLTLQMSATATTALGAGQHYDQQWVYDLEIVTPGSPAIVDRVLTGVVTFSPEVTRD